MTKIKTYITWLKEFKSEQKISYKKLGNTIGYSDAGISKALDRNTLSIQQIEVIAKSFGGEESLKKFIDDSFKNQSNKDQTNIVLKDLVILFDNLDEDELSLLLLKYKDRIIKNEVISLFIQQEAIKMAKNILIEDIKSKI